MQFCNLEKHGFGLQAKDRNEYNDTDKKCCMDTAISKQKEAQSIDPIHNLKISNTAREMFALRCFEKLCFWV